jgi:hypothetical protein
MSLFSALLQGHGNFLPQRPHNRPVIHHGKYQIPIIATGRRVRSIREKLVDTFSGKIFIKELPYASSSSRQCFHLQARRKRVAGKRQTVLRFQPENGDGSCGTNGQTMLTLKTVAFQRLRDFREMRAGTDDRTRTITHTGIAPDALFRVYNEIEFHRLYSRRCLLQSTAGSIRRPTPSRRMGTGRLVPSLKVGLSRRKAEKVGPAQPGVKRESP